MEMYKNIAWNNFCKTGNLESFMEYKKLEELSGNIKLENIGELEDEVNQSEGDCNKGDTI